MLIDVWIIQHPDSFNDGGSPSFLGALNRPSVYILYSDSLKTEIGKRSVYSAECKSPNITLAKPYHDPAGMLCYMAGHHNEIADNSP